MMICEQNAEQGRDKLCRSAQRTRSSLQAFGFAAVAVLAIPAFGQSLPADVSTRVGRAAEFVYQYTPEQYAGALSSYDVVWSNNPDARQGGAERLHFPAGVFSGANIAVNRVPAQATAYGPTRIMRACGIPSGGCPLSWFQKEHPNWVIYKSDMRTPAWQYNDETWIPLDISNPQVQSWIEANALQPIYDAGYQSVSIDNVTYRNDFGEVGTCSVRPTQNCVSEGGVWTRLYSGKVVDDPQFIANRISWARQITAWAHARSKSTMANVTYGAANKQATAQLVNAFDIWYDEDGFTGDGVPSPCTPKNSTSVVGQAWVEKVAFITGLNGGAGPRAYVAENSICPLDAPRQQALKVVEFAVASYLIVKNSHTYMTMYFAGQDNIGNGAYFNDDKPGGSWPQFNLVHGKALGSYKESGGIFYRSFAQALALVNPWPDRAGSYDLGGTAYYRSDCTRYTGRVQIGPITGMVLLKSQPSQCR